MRFIYQSTAQTVSVLMVSTDHVTGLAGQTLAVSRKKPGGDFEVITPTVTDRGYGWYDIVLSVDDTDTLGDLVLHLTSDDTDPSDVLFQVVVVGFGVTTTAEDIAAAIASTVVLEVDTPNDRLVDTNGTQLATVNMTQAMAALLLTLCGDRTGVGTRTIGGNINGATAPTISVNRDSQSTIKATLILPVGG